MDLPGASLRAPPPRGLGALAVSADAVRLSTITAILRDRDHYEVTVCTDPAAAMAVLRAGNKFEVLLVDMHSLGCGAPALELLECAVGEMHVHTHVISKNGDRYGPLEMKDLGIIRNAIYNEATNGSKSPEAMPNSPCNNSPVETTPTTTTLVISGRRATRRRMGRTRVNDTNSQELDEVNVKNEKQKPVEKPTKARVIWTDELHKKFVEAHDKLLPGDAVPKKILKLMNDPTLTRENIASHLQKHRMNLDPLRKGNTGTRNKKLTPPQASLLSPNLSRQQASSTMMQSLSSANFPEIITTQAVVCMNHNMNDSGSHPVIQMKSFKASEDMYTGDNESTKNSTWSGGNSDNAGCQENSIEFSIKEPKLSWDQVYFYTNGN
ncbi:hypothetical protein CFC21_009168 [Triticum aestivum]|uniref:HTH myb-type domain-containing protein n=2 Tax=Triticum aestivum TaxID=4565 RepID=A0A3B5Z5R6_WHEAT|nr:two-component response regulator ORR23-like [Triticum aestivum]KAF6992147.1 hypothetical protein CFC21_009168 [Triticum aestivum]